MEKGQERRGKNQSENYQRRRPDEEGHDAPSTRLPDRNAIGHRSEQHPTQMVHKRDKGNGQREKHSGHEPRMMKLESRPEQGVLADKKTARRESNEHEHREGEEKAGPRHCAEEPADIPNE